MNQSSENLVLSFSFQCFSCSLSSGRSFKASSGFFYLTKKTSLGIPSIISSDFRYQASFKRSRSSESSFDASIVMTTGSSFDSFKTGIIYFTVEKMKIILAAGELSDSFLKSSFVSFLALKNSHLKS